MACMGNRRGALRFLLAVPEEKRPFGRPRHKGRIILKCMFQKWDEGHGVD